MTNRNTTTGAAFGVANMNALAPWLWDEIESNGKNLTLASAEADYRAELGREPTDNEWQEWHDRTELSEESWEAEVDGHKVGVSWLGGAPLLWVFDGPTIVYARPCSPCVPGAGDLDALDDDNGYRTHGFPPAWRGDE